MAHRKLSQWSMVNSQGSIVKGQWSRVNGQWSMVNGQGSMVKISWIGLTQNDQKTNRQEAKEAKE